MHDEILQIGVQVPITHGADHAHRPAVEAGGQTHQARV